MDAKTSLAQYQQSILDQGRKALQEYDRQVVGPCASSIRTCKGIALLRSDPSSLTLLIEVIRELHATDEVAQYFRYIHLAYELQNQRENTELDLLNLSRSAEYLAHLEKQGATEELARHKTAVLTLLGQRSRLEGKPEFAKYLEESGWWRYTDSRPDHFLKTLFQVAVTQPTLFYDSTGALSTHFQKAINTLDTHSESGFSSLVAAIRSIDPKLLETLQIPDMGARDEYFYLVASVFNGEINPETARVLWLQTRQDLPRFQSVLDIYLRTQFVHTIARSNSVMREFYSNASAFTASNLFHEAFKKSEEITPLWRRFFAHNETMRTLFRKILAESPSQDRTGAQAAEIQLFDQFKRNVKFMVTYPHMIMLAYQMALHNFSLKIRSWVTLDIDATQVINQLFEGEFSPWFDFHSGEQKPLTSAEILLAFHFGVSTGLFETFRVDPESFFLLVSQKLLSTFDNRITQETQTLRSRYRDDLDYDTFLRICQGDKAVQLPRVLSIRDVRYWPFLGRLANRFYSSGEPGKQMNVFGGTLEDRHETVRVELGRKSRLLRSMIDIYTNYLRARGKSESDIASFSTKVSAPLENSAKIVREFYTEFFAMHDRLLPCLLINVQQEQDLKLKLFAAEETYLRQAHRDIVRLRKGEVAEDELEKRYRIQGYGESYSGFDRLTASGLQYSQMDFFVRLKHTLARIAPEIVLDIPNPIQPDLLDKEIRAGFLNRQYTQLSFTESEDDFVKSGFTLLQYNSKNRSGYVHWIRGLDFSPVYFRSLVAMEASVYKAGVVELADHSTRQISTNEMVKLSLDIAHLLTIAPEEVHPMKLLQEAWKFDPFQLADVYFDSTSGQAKGSLDYTYQHITAPLLGYYTELPWVESSEAKQHLGPRPSPLEETEAYAKMRRNSSGFLFQLDPILAAALDERYRRVVNQEFTSISDFEKAAHMRESADRQSGHFTGVTCKLQGEQPIPPYLSPDLLENQASKQQVFHRSKTDNFYLP